MLNPLTPRYIKMVSVNCLAWYSERGSIYLFCSTLLTIDPIRTDSSKTIKLYEMVIQITLYKLV